MIGSTSTQIRMVNGLIEIKFDVVVEERVPKGIYCTVSEYAQMHEINESTLRSAISRGVIPSFLFYGKRLIPADFEVNKSEN